KLAESLVRGESAGTAFEKVDRAAFLPMLRWVLATGEAQGSLVRGLLNLAELYRKRAKFHAEKLHVFLPTILLIVIGCAATLIYGLSLFIPLVNMLRGLSL